MVVTASCLVVRAVQVSFVEAADKTSVVRVHACQRRALTWKPTAIMFPTVVRPRLIVGSVTNRPYVVAAADSTSVGALL